MDFFVGLALGFSLFFAFTIDFSIRIALKCLKNGQKLFNLLSVSPLLVFASISLCNALLFLLFHFSFLVITASKPGRIDKIKQRVFSKISLKKTQI